MVTTRGDDTPMTAWCGRHDGGRRGGGCFVDRVLFHRLDGGGTGGRGPQHAVASDLGLGRPPFFRSSVDTRTRGRYLVENEIHFHLTLMRSPGGQLVSGLLSGSCSRGRALGTTSSTTGVTDAALRLRAGRLRHLLARAPGRVHRRRAVAWECMGASRTVGTPWLPPWGDRRWTSSGGGGHAAPWRGTRPLVPGEGETSSRHAVDTCARGAAHPVAGGFSGVTHRGWWPWSEYHRMARRRSGTVVLGLVGPTPKAPFA